MSNFVILKVEGITDETEEDFEFLFNPTLRQHYNWFKNNEQGNDICWLTLIV